MRCLKTLLLLLLLPVATDLRAVMEPGGSTPEASADHATTNSGTSDDKSLEQWYRIDVDGKPSGWSLSRETRHDGRLTTSSLFHLRFTRGAAGQTLELESRFVETLDGKPVSAWSRQDVALKPLETTWSFLPDTVLVETVHGAHTSQQSMPWPAGEWLTPGQEQSTLRRLIASGEERFTLRGLDPQLGLDVVETEWLLEQRGVEVPVGEPKILARRFRQTQSFAPQLATLADVTDEGLVVRMVTSMMGLEMTMTLTTRKEALASRETPDLLLRSFLYPDRPIREPRRARRVLYEIHAGSEPLSLPSTGSQRVLGSSADSSPGILVLVEVGSSPRLHGKNRPDAEEYLRASTFIDHRDDGVRRLLADATRDSAPGRAPPSTLQRAEALRAFVATYLENKNLDSLLATASEVAQSRSGDCTEHSMLLAALLRADGIPARLVTGLVYVDELIGARHLFGYHMWTQALIDDRWIDLDATLSTPFDAAHVAFSTTALNDDHTTLAELTRLASLLGKAEIRVIDVGY